jgi:predicted CXXCH cytochrome family protein
MLLFDIPLRVRPVNANIGLIAIVVAPFLGTNCSRRQQPAAAYVDSSLCRSCHAQIFARYSHTGMARSFYQPRPENTIEAYGRPFYHRASDTWFRMERRSDGYYQRRWQIGYRGKEENVEDLKVDYVMGSGNHVRTYLHRTGRGTLIEAPLAWYSEKGGYWAMNPGYDSDHPPSRRKIGYDCMFCHNAYPAIPAGHEEAGSEPIFAGALPEGIDCQRCHGPGANHVRTAQTAGAAAEDARKAIVNPERLAAGPRMEVCMQCHLETTSFRLPNAIRRFDRGPFSYRPGEPLGEFMIFFDHAPGAGRDDKYEIVNSAYRLRKSQCFLRSNGALTCLTCHNPHDSPHGPEADRHYNGVCRQCHGAGFNALVVAAKHTAGEACVDCHMPKRRTEDVVHAVMTDHLIQRRPPAGNLLADLAERHETNATAYRGEVIAYYPNPLSPDRDKALYTAVAQVSGKSNLERGAAQLEAAIGQWRPERAEFYLELGDAWRNQDKSAKAVGPYEHALTLRPASPLVIRRLAGALRSTGQSARALETLQQASSLAPDDAQVWYDLGLSYSDSGRQSDALLALQKAAELDPDMAEAQNTLGAVWAETGAADRAETAFRAALRIRPAYGDAHANLANLLAGHDDFEQAAWHYDRAVRLVPNSGLYRFNYGVTLARMNRYDEAQEQFRKAAKDADPGIRGQAIQALQQIAPAH